MTSRGGSVDLGVIFKIKADGTDFKKIFDFNSNSGGIPDGSLVLVPTPTPAILQSASARSAVAEAVVENAEQQVSIDANPNPFLDVLYLNIAHPVDTEFQSVMMDTNGRIVATHKGQTNSTTAITNDLSQGLYILKVKVGGDVTKFIRVIRR